MLSRVLKFVRLPWLLLLLFATFRFLVGIRGVPYAPRGNAMFSVVVLTIVSGIYWGALSKRVGRFSWLGTVLVGLALGLFAQILVFGFTVISFAGHFSNSYYLNPDALNVPEGTVITWAHILGPRTGGLVVNCILAIVAASLGRVLSFLAPKAEA
jgi:hypothetical protein